MLAIVVLSSDYLQCCLSQCIIIIIITIIWPRGRFGDWPACHRVIVAVVGDAAVELGDGWMDGGMDTWTILISQPPTLFGMLCVG